MGWIGKVRGWLQGKKTMLGGLVLIAAGVAGVAFGQISLDQCVAVAGMGISIAGWAAKADRHQKQILEALTAAAAAGAAYRAGDKAAIQNAVKAELPAVLDSVIRETTAKGAAI